MCSNATRIASLLVVAGMALLASRPCHALREDTTYNILLVCPEDCSEAPSLQILYDEISSILPPSPSAITIRSVEELAGADWEELPDYTFGVWHFEGSGDATWPTVKQAAKRMLAAELPLVVIDDEGFPTASALGLTDDQVGGSQTSSDSEALQIFGDQVDRGVYHDLLSAHAEPDPLTLDLQYSTSLGSSSADVTVNYVDRAEVLTESHTRSIVTLDDSSSQKIAVVVNDNMQIVVSGILKSAATSVPHLLHQMIDYATAVGPEAAAASWIAQPALDNENESLLFSPGGQSTLVEVDWTQPARGFDFTITRTYRSGAHDLYSYLGENWYLNHDRYLVHDTFNDRLYVHDGTGNLITMEQVQDRRRSRSERNTFVAINSSVTDVATYYSIADANPFTRVNPFLGATYDPDDHDANIETCIGSVHPTDPGIAFWSAGFVIRDAGGNIAFYRKHEINESNFNPLMFGNQKLRTKGGSLVHYRLAYLMDKNGNRQNYYYAYTDQPGSRGEQHETPEPLLWCVVDTEGRGNFFDIHWTDTDIDAKILGSDGPSLPWLRYVYTFDDWNDGDPWYSLWYTFDGTGNDGCGFDNTYHGLLLVGADLNKGGAGNHVLKVYDYDFSAYDGSGPIGCNASGWGNHFVPLKSATDWTTDPGASPVVEFGYEAPAADTCNGSDADCALGGNRFYQGRLLTLAEGRDDQTIFPPEVASETQYSYGVKPGRPNYHDLDEAYGWVSSLKNGVGQTQVFNALYHLIEKRLWYTGDRCPDGDDSLGVIDCTDSAELHEDPGPCDDWTIGWPTIPCGSKSWIWRFRTNYDGQVVWSKTPVWAANKWIEVEHRHVFEWALQHDYGGVVAGEPVAAQLLEFWSDRWPQRAWMANLVETITHGWEGQQIETLTSFEPVFNQPLEVRKEEMLVRRLSYDYLVAHDSGLSTAGLLAMMRIPHALLEDWQLASCPYDNCRFQMFDDAAMPWGECLEPVTQGPSQDPDEGNLVCEEVRFTETLGQSIGRSAAAAVFEFDQFGRMTTTTNLDGRVVVEEYEDSADGLVKTVSRIGLGSADPIQTRYHYDARGQNFRKVMAVEGLLDSPGSTCVFEDYEYNGLGRLVGKGISSGSCSWPDGAAVERLETYEHDPAGNVVASRTVRCPGTDPGICVGGSTGVGERLDRFMRYDSKRRTTWDCQEISYNESDDTTELSCTVQGYGEDDRLAQEGGLEQCSITGSVDESVAILGCADAWDDFRFVIEHGYDERRLRHRTRAFDPASDPATPDRITRTYHDVLGRVAASHDAADSDCSGVGCGDPEWTRVEHDGLGRVSRTTIGLDNSNPLATPGAVATFTSYDAFDNMLLETRGAPTPDGATDATLGETEFAYDARGAQIARYDKTYPVGGSPADSDVTVSYFSYDQNDRIELTVEENTAAGLELTSVRVYDDYGRLEWTGLDSHDVDVYDVFYQRDQLGRALAETRVDFSQLDEVEDTGAKIARAFNAAGQIVSLSRMDISDDPDDPLEAINSYDGLGHLTRSVDPELHETLFDRDGLGHETRRVEMLAGDSWYYSDGFESPWVVYSAIEVFTEHDGLGNVVRRIDGKGNATEYDRNAFGEIVGIDMPGSTAGEPTPAFDNRYQKRFELNQEGAITGIARYKNYSNALSVPQSDLQLALDRFNRPQQISNGEDESLQLFYYDGNGNVTLAFDYGVQTAEIDRVRSDRSWDTAGYLIADRTEIQGLSGDASWEATATYTGGRLDQIQNPSGTVVHHDYWSSSPMPSRVTVSTLDDDEDYVGSFLWFGETPLQRKQIFEPGQYVRTSFEWDGQPYYDGFGRLTGVDIEQLGDTNETVGRFEYAYNKKDRLVAEDKILGAVGRDIDYVLDDIDRVETFQTDSGSDQYYLDQANNVRQLDGGYHGRVELTVDHGIVDDGDDTTWGLNQVTAIRYVDLGGLERSLGYDFSGRLVSDSGAPEQSSRTLAWDELGRLVEVEQGSGARSVFVYDAFGRRVRKIVEPDSRTTDRYDYRMLGDDVLEEHQLFEWEDPELWVTIHDPTGKDRYLRWDRYRGTSAGWELEERYVPVADARNNVLAVRTKTGSVELEYNLYGEELEPHHGQHIPFRFAGRRYDEDTGLYYSRTRYYAPELGRFISLDSIGIWGDLINYGNGYAYVGNMSNALIDPFGKDGCDAQPDATTDSITVMAMKAFAQQIKGTVEAFVKDVQGGISYENWEQAAAEVWLGMATSPWSTPQKVWEKAETKQEKETSEENTEILLNTLKEQNQVAEEQQELLRLYKEALRREGVDLAEDDEEATEPEDEEPDPNGDGTDQNMPAPDSPGALSKEDIHHLSAIGVIKQEPKRFHGSPGDHGYDKPGSGIWAWKNRNKHKRARRFGSDDGRIYLPFSDLVRGWTNWEGKLKLHDPGVVDPLPNKP
jgi:RHS repeat-associated protein